MLKPQDNPPMLWAPGKGTDRIDLMAGPWWVAHTRARFEKAFVVDLQAREVGYFLPMVEKIRFSGGRKRKVLLPLFPGYVFFCGSEEDRIRALETNRLCQVLPVLDRDRLVAELGQLNLALGAGADLELCQELEIGRRCRVTSGPFQGIEGTLSGFGLHTRLILEVGMLGRGAKLEIDRSLVELVDETSATDGAAMAGAAAAVHVAARVSGTVRSAASRQI